MKRADTKEEIIVLGKMPKKVERETSGLIIAADICMYDTNLYTHVGNRHPDIAELDTDLVSYVNYVIKNFFEIRRGTGKSYILIAKPNFNKVKTGESQKSMNVAYIVLQENQITTAGTTYTYWEVKSGHPRRKKNLKTEVIWRAS